MGSDISGPFSSLEPVEMKQHLLYKCLHTNYCCKVGRSSLYMFKTQCLAYIQLSSVTQSWPTLCDPTNRSTPGLPVHHQLPEFTQTHVHRVGDAIQPSHPLSSPSPLAPNPSQRQGLFQWVNSSHEVAKGGVSASASVLPMNTQDWSPLILNKSYVQVFL